MSAGFEFNNIQMSDRADITKVMENFSKIETDGIKEADAKIVATTSNNGLMSKEDKAKLDNIATGATNVTKTSDIQNDSGFISQETDPTVPSWAKESTKPSYGWNEIGSKPTFVTQQIVSNFWLGSQADYDAIETKSATTMYMIYEEAD